MMTIDGRAHSFVHFCRYLCAPYIVPPASPRGRSARPRAGTARFSKIAPSCI